MKRGRTGLRAALAGLASAWRREWKLWLEVTILATALALAVWLDVSLVPVVLAGGLVLTLEVVNTAIETVVDLASPERQPLAGDAKDFAAAAVLLAAVTSLVIGLLHLGPPLLARLWEGRP
jgi:diacylglycerol kinase (ATP)